MAREYNEFCLMFCLKSTVVFASINEFCWLESSFI